MKTVLTIAGSDSIGGAGIQADIKTISANGCYAMSVITSVTAQNTIGVTGIHDIPPEFVLKQLEAVFDDIVPFLNEDCLEFANEYRAREVIEKYCSFMPTPIFLEKEKR